jgi:hypothetical protein
MEPDSRRDRPTKPDLSRLEEWQESLVSSRAEDGGPRAVGSNVVMVRRLGRREQTSTMETSFSPPSSWAARGIDGPVRAILNGTVEPLDDGARSRVTIELDFEGHGLGKLLVPLVVRRQAQREMPRNMQNLKQRLESTAYVLAQPGTGTIPRPTGIGPNESSDGEPLLLVARRGSDETLLAGYLPVPGARSQPTPASLGVEYWRMPSTPLAS